MPPPGSRYATSVIHPGPPALRMRYRQGVLVTPAGFPDWLLYARAVVRWPEDRLTGPESRTARVIAANLCLRLAGDPLWSELPPGLTPPGWTWAHLPDDRQGALVPIELHGSFRHAGGVTSSSTGRRVDPGTTGMDPEAVVDFETMGGVSAEALVELDRHLILPPVYRDFLASTNGIVPLSPGVLAGFGFVVDQPLFGLGRPDRTQDLTYANGWLRDRFTEEFLAIGYVQGGLLAVRTRGADADSIWFWDDDDPRADETDDATRICAGQLHRVADDIQAFWSALRIPEPLIDPEDISPVQPEFAGVSLPPARRAAWQSTEQSRATDPLVAMFDTG